MLHGYVRLQPKAVITGRSAIRRVEGLSQGRQLFAFGLLFVSIRPRIVPVAVMSRFAMFLMMFPVVVGLTDILKAMCGESFSLIHAVGYGVLDP